MKKLALLDSNAIRTHTPRQKAYDAPNPWRALSPLSISLAARGSCTPGGSCGGSGARVVCAHADHLEMVDQIRSRIPNVQHFVAYEGVREGWLD